MADIFVDMFALDLKPADHPHGSNLSTKAQGQLSSKQRDALFVAIPKYIELLTMANNYELGDVALGALLSKTDSYATLISSPEVNCFSHQSDFASSLLPELLCVLFRRIVKELQGGENLLVTAQRDIVIECNFDIASGGRLIEKRKRMDVAILSPGNLSFQDKEIEFGIPAVCVEVKTNIDKNMLSGIESSVETLKRTFPRSRYFAIGEYCDFQIKSQNYAVTSIDEILIVRRQKRSEVRRTPSAKRPLAEELFAGFLDEVKALLAQTLDPHTNLAFRLPSGRLIRSVC